MNHSASQKTAFRKERFHPILRGRRFPVLHRQWKLCSYSEDGSGIHKRRNRRRNHSANDQTNATYQTFSPLLFSDTPLPLPVCRILPGLSAAAKTERILCLFFIINWLDFRMSPHREPCYNTNKPHCLSP